MSTDKHFFLALNLNPEVERKVLLNKAFEIDDEYILEFIFNTSIEAKELIHLINKLNKFNDVKINIFKSSFRFPTKFKLSLFLFYEYVRELINYLLPSFNLKNVFLSINNNAFELVFKNEKTKQEFELKKHLLNKYISILFGEQNQLKILVNNTPFETIVFEETLSQKNYEIQAKQTSDHEDLPIRGFSEITSKNCNEENLKAYFEGTIFKTEIREIKGGRKIVKLGINNGKLSIYATAFFFKEKEVPKFRENSRYRIYGKFKYNSYSKMFELDFDNFVELKNITKYKNFPKDNSEIKRPELHIHTKMSYFDGVSSVDDYFDFANHYNIPALGFVDHNSVQSYPDIVKVAKKYPNIKPIFGVEFDIFDDLNTKIVINEKDLDLNNAEYVFFDLETTGLSSFVNEIIEIGALRVKNNNIIDKFQVFVKPKQKISSKITELTGIKESDVADANSIEIEIVNFKKFIGDSILVAHNADFDFSFINKLYLEHNLGKITNPIVDTLKISWLLNKDLKNHRLGSIARKYGILYDDSIAHRALYDSEVLHKTFDNMIHAIFEFGIRNLNQFNQYIYEIKDFAFPSHINVYAKNQSGLKKIYKLISESHVQFFNSKKSVPVLPLSELLKAKENDLILTSSCNKGLIWQGINYSSDNLEQYFSYFDYIEIIPNSTLQNLVDENKYTFEELETITKKIVSKAKEFNKKIIATSNAHYAFSEQKVAREIYSKTKGVGGKPHPLFNYQNPKLKTPDQQILNTTQMIQYYENLFSSEEVKEFVITNPIEFSNSIEKINPIQKDLYVPILKNSKEEWEQNVYENFERTYGQNPDSIIKERLEKEMNSIISHNFSVIYYLSSKVVAKSNQDGFLVGSRGSVGSSFAATMSGITEVNPLKSHYLCKNCKYHEFVDGCDDGFDLPTKKCPKCNFDMIGDGHDIPFETFLGFEGDKVPDIDLNFAPENQPIIHNYIKDLIGEKNVFRAGTISTTQFRTAYGFVKSYLEEYEQGKEFTQAEVDYYSSLLIGTKRTTGQHPGGIIIVPYENDIFDFTPINYPGNDHTSAWLTTHFDFETIHDNLLKLDILGHIDPSVLKMLADITDIDPKTINMNDQKVISLFTSSTALNYKFNYVNDKLGIIGIPEFGTAFVREIVEESKPKSFADLIRISGISHGTNVWTGNAKDLIKSGVATLRDVISIRDNIMTYLISMGIENKTAFFITEDVRKGRGLKPEFEKEMKSRAIPQWYIDSCKKIAYMFPKAHATAYVIMAFRIAWFKIYKPLEYYATFFSKRHCEYDIESLIKGPEGIIKWFADFKTKEPKLLKERDKNIYDTYEVVLEMFARGFEIQSISLEKSHWNLWLIDYEKNSLIPPFTIIEGLGENIAEKLYIERNKQQFRNIQDFEIRAGLNKTILEKLKTLKILESLKDHSTEQKSIFDFIE